MEEDPELDFEPVHDVPFERNLYRREVPIILYVMYYSIHVVLFGSFVLSTISIHETAACETWPGVFFSLHSAILILSACIIKHELGKSGDDHYTSILEIMPLICTAISSIAAIPSIIVVWGSYKYCTVRWYFQIGYYSCVILSTLLFIVVALFTVVFIINNRNNDKLVYSDILRILTKLGNIEFLHLADYQNLLAATTYMQGKFPRQITAWEIAALLKLIYPKVSIYRSDRTCAICLNDEGGVAHCGECSYWLHPSCLSAWLSHPDSYTCLCDKSARTHLEEILKCKIERLKDKNTAVINNTAQELAVHIY